MNAASKTAAIIPSTLSQVRQMPSFPARAHFALFLRVLTRYNTRKLEEEAHRVRAAAARPHNSRLPVLRSRVRRLSFPQ
jgi:hypothetical protein